MSERKKIDKIFVITVGMLVLFGFFLFVSASLGLLAKDGAKFSSVFFNQIILGLVSGLIFLVTLSKIHYRKYKKYTLYIFIASLIAVSLVFIPSLGFEHGGARRWLSIFGFSFQPAEFLKLGFVLYFATLLAYIKPKLHKWQYSIGSFFSILALIAIVLLNQPDYGTFLVIVITAMGMIFAAGINFKHISIIALVTTIATSVLVFFKPYVWQRILTFINPAGDGLGAGYQIKQSLIAIGSGEFFGRGFGKSIQKFNLLPEPMGDSIFAVTAEEWGFIGASFLIFLFFFFALRGLRIASRSTDLFGGLLVVGLVILIVSQSFINIASMLGIFPLTGMPLLFVSQGGTALMIALAEVGIILNVSKYQKTS